MYDIDTDKRLYNYSDKQILKRLMSYARPYVPAFILTFFLMFISVALALLEPYIIGLSIDSLTGAFTAVSLPVLLGIFVASILLSAGFEYLQTMILQKTGQSIVYNMREEVFTHVERQDIEYFNKIPTGKLVTRIANDTNTLNEMYTSVIVNVFKNLFTIVGILGAMYLLNARLATLILGVTPFIVVFSFIFRRFSRKAYRTVRANMSRVNGFLAEHLSGMKVVQIFNKEKEKHHEFNEKNTELKNSEMRELLVFAIYRPTMYMLFMVSTIIIFYYGGLQVIAGTLTVGVLVSFYNYLRRFFEPIQQLAEQFNIVQSAFASSERIFAILDAHPEVIDEPDAIELDDVKGDIEFRNVWFQYKEDEWVLKDVSFKVKAKQSVAFVGATGAGKTTILGLLTRNYDIQKGQILLDGIDITRIKISSLRAFIGQMLQDVFMFSGTIADNIRLSSDIDDQQIQHIAEAVDAHRFISRLPRNYESEVKERGATMSAGQRQLLAFARALAFEPKILILDEATASIDTETEQIIQKAMKTISRGRTTLVVAHRLSTIQSADKIIVMHKGKVREIGSHQELLARGGYYYNLYQLQYKEQEPI